MTAEFAGRQIVVTGGTGALGGAVVALLMEKGAAIHVPSSRPDADPRFAGNDRVKITPGIDLADSESVDAYYASVPELWASINLAGGFAMAPIERSGPREFAGMIDANARTAFLCCAAAARSMLASGGGGRIVNVAARPALEPRRGAGMAGYAAGKAAVAAITVALAEELKGAGILVNAVAPSTLDTPANRAAMPKADFGKWVALGDAAAAISWLASPGNRATSGAVLPLYGRA